MRIAIRKNIRRYRGVSLIETALVLPIVMLVMVAIIESARYYFIQSILTNAAREGARYGILNPTDTNGITTAAQRFTAGIGGENVGVAVNTPNGRFGGAPLIVTVSYNTSLNVPGFSKRLRIIRQARMLIE